MTTADDPSNQSASARRILGLLDLTSLGDDDQPADVERLCKAAITPFGSVAAVCIWPRFVPLAVELMAGTDVGVCAVANFPAGKNDSKGAIADAMTIVDGGGAEVDVVVPWRDLAAGESGVVTRLVSDVRAAIGAKVTLKAILETGELSSIDLVTQAGTEALEGGADFLKTSTGKTAHSATIEAAAALVKLIAEARRDDGPGIKISGGVRDRETAERYLQLADDALGRDWAGPATFRFGASGLLDDLLAALDEPEA